ncbi:glycosyltransferase family 4 protein [soil metagenome]
MKIGFVFDDSLDKPDGIQQYMFSLAEWLTTEGHEVHYLVGQTVRTDIPNVHSLSRNIKVQFNGNRLSIPLLGSKKRIRAVLAAEKFDVLHVQVPYHPLMAGRVIAAADSSTAIFGTFHVAPYSKFVIIATRLLGLWSKPTLKKFNTMVSVSPAAAELARQTFGIETEVVPNVFDYQRFHRAMPLERYDDQMKTIVFLGRLVPRKGCMLLLQAVAALKEPQGSFRVVVCGGGPLEGDLRAYVKSQGLESIVEFVGRVSEADKPRYFASADIAVFPSSAGESFGIVLIEAMASGKAAVLGGNNPGYRSVLGKHPDQLINVTDPAELTGRLQTLLHHEPARVAAASWGMQESAQYDVKTVGKKLVTLYSEVAQSSSKEA